MWYKHAILLSHTLVQQVGSLEGCDSNVELVVSIHDGIAPAKCSKLRTIQADAAHRSSLLLKAAAVFDTGEGNVQSGGRWSRNIADLYEVVSTVLASIYTTHFPNVAAIAR